MDSRVIVVTGGAQGIGFAVAKRLANHAENKVVIVDRNEEGAKAAAAQLPEGRAFGYGGDITDMDGLTELAAQIKREVGPVEVLCSCAGIGGHGRFDETTLEEQHRQIDVNLHGHLNLTRAFMEDIKASGHGRLVYIASDAARVGVGGEAVYAAAKAGVVAFAKSMAVELARYGVTSNVVCPGSTNTEMFRSAYNDEQIAKRMKIHPMRRPAEPDEVATALEYFASRDASFTTAQVMSVSGGMARVG